MRISQSEVARQLSPPVRAWLVFPAEKLSPLAPSRCLDQSFSRMALSENEIGFWKIPREEDSEQEKFSSPILAGLVSIFKLLITSYIGWFICSKRSSVTPATLEEIRSFIGLIPVRALLRM